MSKAQENSNGCQGEGECKGNNCFSWKKKKPKKMLVAASEPKPRSRPIPMPKPSATAGPTKSRAKAKKGVATDKPSQHQGRKFGSRGPADQRDSANKHLTLSCQTWKSMSGLQSTEESSLGDIKGRLVMMLVGLVNVVVNS